MFHLPEALLLARIQFAFTVSFHFLFPAITIGLASYLAVLEGLWLKTGRADYMKAASIACRYVRRSVRLDGPLDTRGGVKGSFPVDGEYGRYEYLNWAAKFLADALLLERDIRDDEIAAQPAGLAVAAPANLTARSAN